MGYLDTALSWGASAMDYADEAFDFVVGGLGEAGNWMQDNPGAATMIGSALVAGGSYLENREALKAQKEAKADEWRERERHGMAVVAPLSFNVTPGLTGNAMTDGGVLSNGLLANIQNNKKGDY